MESSLENLYHTFAKYRLRLDIGVCSCCVTESDKKRLQKKELRKLAVDDLGKYFLKAVTTWGDEYDLKHFLPRILELMDELPSDMVLIKLQSVDWETWPSQEKDAIVAYLEFRLESLKLEISQQLNSTSTDEVLLEELEWKMEEITDFLNNNEQAAYPP